MKMTVRAASMAVMVVAAILCSCGMVAPAEGRALLNMDKLIDHLKAHCPPPPSDPAPEPYTPSEPSPVDMTPPLPPAPAVYEPSPEYESPPYSSPSPVDPSPVYQAPPPGGY